MRDARPSNRQRIGQVLSESAPERVSCSHKPQFLQIASLPQTLDDLLADTLSHDRILIRIERNESEEPPQIRDPVVEHRELGPSEHDGDDRRIRGLFPNLYEQADPARLLPEPSTRKLSPPSPVRQGERVDRIRSTTSNVLVRGARRKFPDLSLRRAGGCDASPYGVEIDVYAQD